MTKLLAICIPTYNGGEYLKYNIKKLIDMSLKYNFDICVSDNASTDDTQEYMLNLITKYDFIKYHRNDKNMGFAYNFDYVLKMSDTKYAWLLGDDDEILENGLIKVIEILNKYKPGICIVNGINNNNNNKVINNIDSKLYTNKDDVLIEIGRIISWISTIIISKKIIKDIDANNFKENAFPHWIEILNFISNNCNLYWIKDVSVKIQKNCLSRYSNKYLDYFIKDRYYAIKKIKGYKRENKKIFFDMSINKNFSLGCIISLRRKGILNKKNLFNVKNELKNCPKKVQIYLKIFSKMPICLLDFVLKIRRILIK